MDEGDSKACAGGSTAQFMTGDLLLPEMLLLDFSVLDRPTYSLEVAK